MATPLQRLLTRAITPALGNLKGSGGAVSSGKGPRAATAAVSYQSPGMPQILDQDASAFGEAAYLSHVYVMRCVQTIANTIAGLEFRAGLDPTDPASQDPSAPLAQLLGPSTPNAPGGPNPTTSSRAFWAWTICQYIVYGRFGWETQLDKKQIVALWPLVSACLAAIPTSTGTQMFQGYVYTPSNQIIKLKPDECVYAWRPSLQDWRVPETVISAARLPIAIAKGLDRYMERLLANDMVATTLVVSPPFDEPDGRRAWQDQFLSKFSGVDNRGATVFAEAERDEDDTTGQPLIQIEKIAQTAVEASLLEVLSQAKIDITIAFGVPMSLIGNASQRTYANADSEYKNFWTITILPLITEFQDHVNTFLAPRVGREVGWFDLSKVAALQPPPMFTPPMIGDVINFGVASAAQIANVLGIPAADATADADTDTVELGEESSATGAGGSRSGARRLGPVTGQQLVSAYLRYRQAPRNSYTWDREFRASEWLTREHIDIKKATSTPIEVRNDQAIGILRNVEQVKAQRALQAHQARLTRSTELAERTTSMAQDYRALAVADRKAQVVKAKLAETYPTSTLGWVDNAAWQGPTQVDLDQIDMARRPGGRDQAKVAGIAKGIAAGDDGAIAPVVLVKTPGSDKLKIADGYHRTKAHEKLGHKSVNAYVATVADEEGPWDSEMHDKKLNRLADLKLEFRGDPTAPQKCKVCSNPATHSIIWAEGAAYIPVCDQHEAKMVAHIGGPNEVDKMTTIDQERTEPEPTDPELPAFDGGDFDSWVEQNGTALEALANAT